MISLSEYYEKNLYPLQDGVLNIISQSGTGFFLTGGTALSRAYYHHRYSDDLDFFINSSAEYDEQMDIIFAKLEEKGFFWNTGLGFTRNDNFISFRVQWKKSDVALQLDFVNDLVPHFGPIVKTDLFYRTDSIQNILSNKITALFRFDAKDVADLREIFLNEKIDWPEAFRQAREKEAGIEIPVVCEILTGIPEAEFDCLKWIKKPFWQDFRTDVGKMVEAILSAY